MADRAAAEAIEVEPRLGLQPQQTDNGVGLRTHLLRQFKAGLMTAKNVCVTAFFATLAGARGVDDLAQPPSSTHCSEHLRAAVEARSIDSFYFADIPMWCSETNSRIK
eukprot:6992065-Pyramimonas_sp.AAC.1